MKNLAIALNIIKKCNKKFSDGTTNLKTSLFDTPEVREPIRESFRQKELAATLRQLAEDSDATGFAMERAKALAAGRTLDESAELKVGNCGERSLWCAYKLVEDSVENVSIVQGNTRTSINHTFVVLGATGIPPVGQYMIDKVPDWTGDDIVICEPWFQDGQFLDYSHGVAYPLTKWPEMMPRIVAEASRRTINPGDRFELHRLL